MQLPYKVILNLTNHRATPVQQAGGVEEHQPGGIRELLQFETAPTSADIKRRVEAILAIADNLVKAKMGWTDSEWGDNWGRGIRIAAMLGGAPFIMPELERALSDALIQPIYPFIIKMDDGQYVQDGWVIPDLYM